jgi:UPF0716 family protein affecting phage T7 exclusion
VTPRSRRSDLLIVVPLALVSVGTVIASVLVGSVVGAFAGVFLLAAVAALFWWLTTHQGPATQTKEEQAEQRLHMSGNWPGGSGGGGGGAY